MIGYIISVIGIGMVCVSNALLYRRCVKLEKENRELKKEMGH